MKQLTPRKSDRSRFLVDVEVRCLKSGNQFKAHGIDISQSGMALFAKRFVAQGEAVEVAVRTTTSIAAASVVKILGSIAYARVEDEGNILGVTFARALSSQEMQGLKIPCGASSCR
jgi:hypothetical protein